jgi:hypothetical protein
MRDGENRGGGRRLKALQREKQLARVSGIKAKKAETRLRFGF